MQYGKFFPKQVIYLAKPQTCTKTYSTLGAFNSEELLASPIIPLKIDTRQQTINHYRNVFNGGNVLIVDNVPISNLRIIDINYNGGFIMITEDGYSYPYSAYNFADSIMHSDIKQGGYIDGQYVWCFNNNTFQLVRVGSQKFDLLQRRQELNELPFIKKSNLNIGDIYTSKSDIFFVYLGKANSKQLTTYSISDKKYVSNQKYKKITNGLLFAKFQGLEFTTDKIKEICANPEILIDYIKILNSHVCVKKIDEVQISNDLFEDLRCFSEDKIKNSICENSSINNFMKQVYKYSQVLFLFKPSESPPELDITKFLIFM